MGDPLPPSTSATGLHIRSLSPADDLGALTDLLHRAYASLAARGWNYTAASQDEATTRRRATLGTCLVAEVDGRIVGTLSLHSAGACARMAREGSVALEQFAVEPALQGRGIGAALLAEAEARARALGADEVVLDTAMPALHLVRWYERLGWQVVDSVQWPGKAYESVILAKPLAP